MVIELLLDALALRPLCTQARGVRAKVLLSFRIRQKMHRRRLFEVRQTRTTRRVPTSRRLRFVIMKITATHTTLQVLEEVREVAPRPQYEGQDQERRPPRPAAHIARRR